MSKTEARRVRAFPPPRYYELLGAYCHQTGLSQSKSINIIIKKFFDDLPAWEIDKIIKDYRFLHK